MFSLCFRTSSCFQREKDAIILRGLKEQLDGMSLTMENLKLGPATLKNTLLLWARIGRSKKTTNLLDWITKHGKRQMFGYSWKIFVGKHLKETWLERVPKISFTQEIWKKKSWSWSIDFSQAISVSVNICAN